MVGRPVSSSSSMYTTCSAALPDLSDTSYRNTYLARASKSTEVTRQWLSVVSLQPQNAWFSDWWHSLFSLFTRNTRVTMRLVMSLSWWSQAWATGNGQVSIVVPGPAGQRALQSCRLPSADCEPGWEFSPCEMELRLGCPTASAP